MVALLLLIKKNSTQKLFVNEKVSGSIRRISSRFTNLKRKSTKTSWT